MHQYIMDTEFAVTSLIQLATAEENRLKELSTQLKSCEARLETCKWDFESSEFHDDFSDAYVMGAFARMAQADKEVQPLQREHQSLNISIATRQYSVQAISGSILQIAKHGISLCHGKTMAGPPGRAVGTTLVRDIIWCGRNQAIHYEEGTFNGPTTELFSKLVNEQGEHFSLTKFSKQSRAKQVLALLGWSNYARYLLDMQSLLPDAT